MQQKPPRSSSFHDVKISFTSPTSTRCLAISLENEKKNERKILTCVFLSLRHFLRRRRLWREFEFVFTLDFQFKRDLKVDFCFLFSGIMRFCDSLGENDIWHTFWRRLRIFLFVKHFIFGIRIAVFWESFVGKTRIWGWWRASRHGRTRMLWQIEIGYCCCCLRSFREYRDWLAERISMFFNSH